MNIIKNPALEKIAKAALRKTGGLEIREIERLKIAAFDLNQWADGIKIPKGMEEFQEEERIVSGQKVIFLFPPGVQLEKAA